MQNFLSFRLSEEFISEYTDRKVEWGLQDAGGTSFSEIVFLRTYSRKREDGSKETWQDVCRRVVEGTYSIQKDWAKSNRLPWNDNKAAKSAQEMFDRMFHFKWTPPGRGLATMGTPMVNEAKSSSTLQNCSSISLGKLNKSNPGKPFGWLMEASMLGIGVGYSLHGLKETDITLTSPQGTHSYVVPDSREGWAESTRLLINAFLTPTGLLPEFDYSEIRPEGALIKSFKTPAPGPGPLIKLHSKITELMTEQINKKLDTVLVSDIANLIGRCVVSGNTRRSALLAYGDLEDEDFVNLKNWKVFPERNGPDGWSFMSNNSVKANSQSDLTMIAEGIKLNGEPGIVWEDVVKTRGRLIDPPDNKDDRFNSPNPCSEIFLENGEYCVAGHTLIHTKKGLFPIISLVGKKVSIWNGKQWSEVEPFQTGNKDVYRVTLSDGSYLDATENHEWSVKKNRTGYKYYKLKTTELEKGNVLPEFFLEFPEGKDFKYAYQWGWFVGDGFVDKSGKSSHLMVQEFERERAGTALGIDKLGAPCHQYYTGSVWYRPRGEKYGLYFDKAQKIREVDELPAEIFTWSSKSIAEFMGGWIDTDGSLIKQTKTDHYLLYGSENRLRQAQMLLRRIGVNHSTLRLFSKKGTETNLGTRRKDLYRLLIPSYESAQIRTRLKIATKFNDGTSVNKAFPDTKISMKHRQKIVKVEKIASEVPTYCFNEPLEHMGVFGNVLTYQCTLSDLYVNHHDSLEDFKRSIKFAFLYAKTVTLLPSHSEMSNAVMQRNRRIGLSISGCTDFIDEKLNGFQQLRHWFDEGYKTVRYYDKLYSEWLCVRESNRVTAIKPGGTTGIVAASSAGVHWTDGGEYYLRALRLGNNDPLIPYLKQSGHVVEPDVMNSDSTSVAYFPIRSGSKRSARQVSLFEKSALAVEAQKLWADNGVSVTLTFDSEKESETVSTILNMYSGQFKSVSFLPVGNAVYPQQPYSEITQNEFELYEEQLFPTILDNLYANWDGADVELEAGCQTDSCDVRAEILKNEVNTK